MNLSLTESLLIHEIFSETARRAPERMAVHYDGTELCYADLEAESNRLAHYLREIGVGPGELVGVMMDKTEQLPVALLGIMKSGGAYVPLDPLQPVLRLKEIAVQARLRTVVTQSALIGRAKEIAVQAPLLERMIPLDEGAEDGGADGIGVAVRRCPSERPETVNSPGDLACVLFTSGTTGIPKGVMLHHRGLVNCLLSNYRQFGLNADDRYLNVSPYGFDMSLFEIFSPLLGGARLYLLPSSSVQDPWIIARSLERHGITVWNSVPTTWSLWMNLLGTDFRPDLGKLRLAFLGGERLPAEFARRAAERLPGTLLVNVYGPTETSIWMNCHPLTEPLAPEAERVHVGKPIPGVQVYIADVDNGSRLCAPGEVGEICISGVGVSHGYLHDEARTKASFVEHPFDPNGGLMYRTGDLGTWLPDGNLDIVGRKDMQVKIRGFRIELGEIESQAVTCPGIERAAAAVRENKDGSKEMLCFVVGESEEAVQAVRGHLKDRLPAYMLPHRICRVAAIPVNRNGKTDRQALLNQWNGKGGDETMTERPMASSAEEVRRTLVEIWTSVLEHGDFQGDTSFFDAGGDSIKVVKVKMSLDERYPDMVDVADLFTHATIDEQTEMLLNELAGSDGGSTDADVGKNDPAAAAPRKEPSGSEPSRADRVGEAAAAAGDDIAIIGMACRLPGGNTPEQFWGTLTKSETQVRRMSPERLKAVAPLGDGIDPERGPKGAFLDDIDRFDALFFQMSPKEAGLIDPQQRLLLEVIQETVDNAGYGGTKLAGSRTGVFVTASSSDYMAAIANSSSAKEPFALLGNQPNMVANRISYFLNLHGPSLFVDTACSSSLAAVHQACRSLLQGECGMALAGGVALHLSPQRFAVVNNLNITSPSGQCRPFDDGADGTVAGEGAGAVLLKPLKAALEDGDPIHAVIKATAVNHGGRSAVLTAPNPVAQSAVIREALDRSGCDSSSISYIETHGTGTPLGDPIEIQSLERVFADGRAEGEERIALGSVKSVIGHLGEAAGIASLIKTVMALTTRTLPGQIHYDRPNPELRLERTPFRISRAFEPWETRGVPRRAGISSFGLGGSNAHIIIEEAPELPAARPAFERGGHILTLSAWTEEALELQLAALSRRCAEDPALSVADACYTLNTGRGKLPFRCAAVVRSSGDLAALSDLERGAKNGTRPFRASGRMKGAGSRPNAFVLGEGPAVLQAGERLYAGSARYRAVFGQLLNLPPDTDAAGLLANPQAPSAVRFAAGYALASLWKEWVPSARLLGIGEGERVVRCLNGNLSPQEAMLLLWQDEAAGTRNTDPVTLPERLALSGFTEGMVAGIGCGLSGLASGVETGWEPLEETAPGLPADEGLWRQLAQLFAGGAEVDWEAFDAGYPRRRIALPSYPFQRERHWFSESPGLGGLNDGASAPVLPSAEVAAALEAPAREQEVSRPPLKQDELIEFLTESIASLLIESVDFDPDTDFSDLELDSLILVELTSMIREHTGVSVNPRLMFEYPTVRLLAACILHKAEETAAQPDGSGGEVDHVH